MYRFYAEVAGREDRREIDYIRRTLAFPLDAVTRLPSLPRTRAILIANPNNPTGTAIDTRRHRTDPRSRAPQAAVLIDEAYYEFCGVTALPLIEDYPNLFVSRTFSKVYGMAAMRMGCLFSQAANVAVSAQSPVALQREHAGRAGRRSRRRRIRSTSRTTSPKRSRRANCCAPGSKNSASHTRPAPRTSSSATSATAPSKSATPCATKPSWSATAATKSPAACASPSAPASRRSASSTNWSKSGEGPDHLRHGRRAGRVTESYRATIQATVKHFTGNEPSHEEIQDWKNRGGWNDDWQLSHRMIQERGGSTPLRRRGRLFPEALPRRWNRRPDPARTMAGLERPLRPPRRAPSPRRLHRPPALGSATSLWTAFCPDRFDPVIGADDVARTKPDPEGLHQDPRLRRARQMLVRRRHGRRRPRLQSRAAFRSSASPRSPIPRYDELVRLLRAEGAVAVLDDINSLEAVIAQNR